MKKALYSVALAVCALVLCPVCFCGCSDDTTAPPSNDDMTVPPSEAMSMESKRAVFYGDYGGTDNSGSGSATYYGVGRTLNVIEDEYITVSAGYSKVFDADKLLALN